MLETYAHLIFGSLKYVVFGIIVVQNFYDRLSTFLCQIIGMCDPRSLDRIKLEGCYFLHIGEKLVEIVSQKRFARKTTGWVL